LPVEMARHKGSPPIEVSFTLHFVASIMEAPPLMRHRSSSVRYNSAAGVAPTPPAPCESAFSRGSRMQRGPANAFSWR
jgi:hypothetical protein